MDAEILFPEIRLFGSKVCSSGKKSRDPAPKISKSRRRKIRMMNMKNSMVSSSIKTISEQPDGDGSNLLFDNNGATAHSPDLAGGGDGRTTLSDSALFLPTIVLVSEQPVVNLPDTPVALAAVQPQSTLPHYNLRPRVSRLW